MFAYTANAAESRLNSERGIFRLGAEIWGFQNYHNHKVSCHEHLSQAIATILPLHFLVMHSSRSRSNCQCLYVRQRARGQAAVGRLHSSPSRSISIERLCRGCAWATASFFRCKKRGVRAMLGRSTKHKHAHHQRVQPWPSASRLPPPPLQEDSFSNDNCESTRSVNTQTN